MTNQLCAERPMDGQDGAGLVQERSVFLGAHFGKTLVGAYAGLGDKRKAEAGARKSGSCFGIAEAAGKGRRVGIFDRQAGSAVLGASVSFPGDVKTHCSGDLVRPQKRVAIDGGKISHFQGGPPVSAYGQSVGRHGHRPKQACVCNSSAEVVNLGARTGLEQVNSYEGEYSVVLRAAGVTVIPLKGAHVGFHQVALAVVAGHFAHQRGRRREPLEIADGAGIGVQARER